MELVRRGLAPTRTRAQAAILSGAVRVNGAVVTRPSHPVAAEDDLRLEVAAADVSRGAVKLRGALDRWQIQVAGRVAVDVGASTGGFTQVLLERGARRVYAVDVGYGQLAWALRRDERVVVLERQNARYLRPELFPEPPDFFTCDVSFISLDKIWPALLACLAPGAEGLALVKPQFEAGPHQVGRRGVVRDARVHQVVLGRVLERARAAGLKVRGLAPSPIRGAEGNLEFFAYLATSGEDRPVDIEAAVAEAWASAQS